jgi:hypothetical protein
VAPFYSTPAWSFNSAMGSGKIGHERLGEDVGFDPNGRADG